MTLYMVVEPDPPALRHGPGVHQGDDVGGQSKEKPAKYRGGGSLSNIAGTLRVVAELVQMTQGKTRYHCLQVRNYKYPYWFESKIRNSVAVRVARLAYRQIFII